MLNTKAYSPFKFLDSYKKNDSNVFFGRDRESAKLFELYRDTSLLILHGPSGSGKTSLIQCGLINRLHINNDAIISIRRNSNIIESFEEEVVGILNRKEVTMPADNIYYIKNYLELTKKSDAHLGKIDGLENDAINLEEQVSKLKQEHLYYTRRRSSYEGEENSRLDEISQNIKEKEDEIDKILTLKNELHNEFIKKEAQKNDAVEDIKNYFQRIYKKVGSIPLVIFDQFEELFVYGTKDEINQFGLILKLIFEFNVPLNIIISLREEYFGHLDLLQAYIPNIFYKKMRLSHPNRETIQEIIYKSFEKFKINQFQDSSNGKYNLPEEEKTMRINLIIDQITIKEDSSISYYLPFLQVYLDRLYKLDYYRTYGNDLAPKYDEDYKNILPLEFDVSEITEFGSIENVLEQYIREINNKIIEDGDNKLDDLKIHKNAVIKFLRNFKTNDDIKKRVSISINDNHYIISDDEVISKIQQDIWGGRNDAEYANTISEIIKCLKDNGILNVSSEYAELSHDIIAKVISNIKIEEDFLNLIKNDFNTSFEFYESNKDSKNLLTEQQLLRMYQYQGLIMVDEKEERHAQKKEYFRLSRQSINSVNRIAIKEKEEQNAKLQCLNVKLENVVNEKDTEIKQKITYIKLARWILGGLAIALGLILFLINMYNKEKIELQIQKAEKEAINLQQKVFSQNKTESDSLIKLLTETIIELEDSLDFKGVKYPIASDDMDSVDNKSPRTDEITLKEYTKNPETNKILTQVNNSQYLVTLYSQNITKKEHNRIQEKIKAAGFSTQNGSVLGYSPSWYSKTPKVFYYSSKSKSIADDLASWLSQELRVKFETSRGNGLGVIKGQEESTFFVHYSK